MRRLRPVGLLLVGAVVGAAGTLLHSSTPWLVVTVLACACLVVAVTGGAGRFAFALGFGGAVSLSQLTPPGGGVLVSGLGGWVLLGLTALLLGIGLGSLPGPRRGRPAADVGTGS